NCCKLSMKGWGHDIGAGCSKDEKDLMNARRKNLCIYVGKEKTGILDVVTKHYYCCFGNMLDKVVNIEGRKQLGMNFGSARRPNCRGLTLAEIQRINFDKVDFSEFINELKVKFAENYDSFSKKQNTNDLKKRIEGNF